MLSKLSIIGAAALMLLLVGCGGDGDSSPAVSDKNVVVDLKEKNPFPTNLLFLPTSQEPADGTLNIPYNPNDSSAQMVKSLNRLDGFSTTSPVVIPTNTLVDPASLYGRVHLYEVEYTYKPDNPLPIPTKVKKELSANDYTFVSKDNSIVIIPLKPLNGASDHIVVVDRGIYNIDGEFVTPNKIAYLLYTNQPLFDENGNPLEDLDAVTLKKIEQLRPYYHALLSVVGKKGESVASIFSFKTQTIGAVAKNLVEDDYKDAKLLLKDSGYSSKDMLALSGADVSTLKGNARIYSGILKDMPYYLGIPTKKNPIAPLVSEMSLNGFKPQLKAKLNIPVLASVPTGCQMPQKGWPVVIFQHGITQNRTNLLAVAETFADICYAAVAIDLPLHGITDTTSPLYMPQYERTFNIDYLTQDEECNVLAYEPDGKPDCSGTHYINLLNPAVSRDNMRQSTGDFVALVNALKSSQTLKFDGEKIAYTGHSLGAMVPFGYMQNSGFDSAVLASPGGGVIGLLFNSETFGPILKEALANAGLEEGSPQFDKYTLLSQTLIDDADPINYAALVGKRQKNLAFEVVGDSVIPNSVLGAPLSGTEPLLKMMGSKNILQFGVPGFVDINTTSIYSKFAYGTHGSLLLPSYPDVTLEMHKEMATYILNHGDKVLVENPAILTD